MLRLRSWSGHVVVGAFLLGAAIHTLGVRASGAGAGAGGTATPEVEQLGVSGGLCVEIGCGDSEFAPRLARSGRFLVQSLDGDADVVAAGRAHRDVQALYGLVSVLHWRSQDRLPYAENLVNLVVLRACPHTTVPLSEVARIVCPGGRVLASASFATEAMLRAAGFADVRTDLREQGWLVATKPWPAEMDVWSHAWHGADGNAVSRDTLVGPPRRVRWIAGPEQEISSLVTAGGRNFYGGVWARDAFNGLRLWERKLSPSPAQGGFSFAYAPGSVRPIAVGDHLVVLTDNVVSMLHGATGTTVRTFPEAGQPQAILHAGGKLLAIARQSISALHLDSGRLLWKQEAAEPRYAVATDQSLFFLDGDTRRGQNPRAVCLDLASGRIRWARSDEPWLPLVRRLVAHRECVVFEVSTLSDTKEGNAIHVAAAEDGRVLWSRSFVPSMNHMKQARALFIGDTLWVLEHLRCVGLDPQSGAVRQTCPAGLCHCFPPVATTRFIFSGEMDLTDLATGQVDAHRITKAACGRDFGWVPANGLIYTSPKHCVCWPMLRGYTALAPAQGGAEGGEQTAARREGRGKAGEREEEEVAALTAAAALRLERGPAFPSGARPAWPAPRPGDWPCYRHDAWRSGATPAELPQTLKTLWTAELGGWPEGMIAEDWRENPFVRGAITAPVAAEGRVLVAMPDRHEVVSLDLKTGALRWRFTADGRVDTPPTICGPLCLFGTRSGSVYCLRAEDGCLAWRLRAAPRDEQIVTHGQIESPWPVPGSVLVADGVAYFAAGRQALADGGILVFAVDPATGSPRWVRRLNQLPMTNFYACVGLEFDDFDLLHREGNHVALSRWLFDQRTGKMEVRASEAFVRLRTGEGAVVVQRGVWTYAPRNLPRFDRVTERLPRPLAVFRGSTLIGCLQDHRTVYRRDFDAQAVDRFDTQWITGWAASENSRKRTGEVWPVERLARDTRWSRSLFSEADRQARIVALVLAGDRLAVAGSEGGIRLLSLSDGSIAGSAEMPAPLWDGMAATSGCLIASTADGHVVCLGDP